MHFQIFSYMRPLSKIATFWKIFGNRHAGRYSTVQLSDNRPGEVIQNTSYPVIPTHTGPNPVNLNPVDKPCGILYFMDE